VDEWNGNTEGLISKMRDYSASYGDRVQFVPLKARSQHSATCSL
jgi:hypothetical protein